MIYIDVVIVKLQCPQESVPILFSLMEYYLLIGIIIKLHYLSKFCLNIDIHILDLFHMSYSFLEITTRFLIYFKSNFFKTLIKFFLALKFVFFKNTIIHFILTTRYEAFMIPFPTNFIHYFIVKILIIPQILILNATLLKRFVE